MQRIEIKNFGPIKNVELDIKDYTIFIGPQASGKSTITRAIYFFRTLKETLQKIMCLLESPEVDFVDIQSFYDEIEKRFFEIWDRSYLNNGTVLRFIYDDDLNNFIEIRRKDEYSLVVQLSDSLSDKFSKIQRSVVSNRKEHLTKEMISFIWSRNFSKFFSDRLETGINYIPAERTIFSVIKNELTPGFDSLFHDVLVCEYIPTINVIRHWIRQKPIEVRLKEKKTPSSQYVLKMYEYMTSILHGEYHLEGDQDYISDCGKRIPLIYASSGQQESLWILLHAIFTTLVSFSFGNTIIEEPESHLFPKTQQDMMHVLTLLANSPHNQLMITTHSPYILTPLNNFLFAHELGQDENKKEDVAKIVDPDLWIDPSRFDCFYVDQGTIESIVDPEVKMMNLEKLDTASQIGNEVYDKLSELEG